LGGGSVSDNHFRFDFISALAYRASIHAHHHAHAHHHHHAAGLYGEICDMNCSVHQVFLWTKNKKAAPFWGAAFY
jgi:hypothetical protein